LLEHEHILANGQGSLISCQQMLFSDAKLRYGITSLQNFLMDLMFTAAAHLTKFKAVSAESDTKLNKKMVKTYQNTKLKQMKTSFNAQFATVSQSLS
jgi:hypothetical protein